MIKYIIPTIISLIFFTACQKVVDADKLLDTEERVYITGYLSPQDTVLRVDVSRIFPSIGTPLSVQDYEANAAKFIVENAQVTISDASGNSTNLIYSEVNNTYLAAITSLSILADQDYFLTVTVDGQEFNASCTIPSESVEINEQINFQDDGFGGMEADINLAFQDIAGIDNFYVLGGVVTATYQYENEEPETYSFSLYFDSDEFLSDNLKDGGALRGKSLTYIGDGIEVLKTTLTLQVANVEEVLFHNLRSASINADADGNPFVEYSIAPNNFAEQGVVGVFAGYQLTEKVIELDF